MTATELLPRNKVGEREQLGRSERQFPHLFSSDINVAREKYKDCAGGTDSGFKDGNKVIYLKLLSHHLISLQILP